jgi:biotin transport system permease protein/energy-coupling factor transport system permease protein
MAIIGAFPSQAVFRYKIIKGPLHKLHAMLKLFLLLPLSVFCMSLSSLWLAAGIIITAAVGFCFRFTLSEQITDLKPAVYYAVLMYTLSVFSNIFENWENLTSSLSVSILILAFIPNPDFLRIALRLVLIIQLSALLFRTTSAIELREGLIFIEKNIRQFFLYLPFMKKRISTQCHFAENLSLFLRFIPQIFSTWSMINLAWKARGGKQGIRNIIPIVFLLISLSMEKAAVKAKALAARSVLTANNNLMV